MKFKVFKLAIKRKIQDIVNILILHNLNRYDFNSHYLEIKYWVKRKASHYFTNIPSDSICYFTIIFLSCILSSVATTTVGGYVNDLDSNIQNSI